MLNPRKTKKRIQENRPRNTAGEQRTPRIYLRTELELPGCNWIKKTKQRDIIKIPKWSCTICSSTFLYHDKRNKKRGLLYDQEKKQLQNIVNI